MKKIEELLNIDLGRKLDTPKKLNRSTQPIPAEVLENLENGIFDCEMIDSLAKSFPIFHYRTCITIHGDWPEVARTCIGQYRNVIQNGNGSVEIKYSAIDREKIKQVRAGIEGVKRQFHFLENSSDRVFRWQQAVNKETYPGIREQMEPIARALASLPIYGYLNLYLSPTLWGGTVLVLDVHPLAIPADSVQALILAICQMSKEEFATAKEAHRIQAEKERAEREAEQKVWQAERDKHRAGQEANAKTLRELIKHFPECNEMQEGILVKVVADQYSTACKFLFRRIDGAGSFGKIKWSQASTDAYPNGNLTALKWIEGKQKKLTDFKKLEGWRLAAIADTDPIKKKISPDLKAFRTAGTTRPQITGQTIATINF